MIVDISGRRCHGGVGDGGTDQAEDFNRLEKLSEYLENEEFFTNNARDFRTAQSYDGERDKKLDAMTNTAARSEPVY